MVFVIYDKAKVGFVLVKFIKLFAIINSLFFRKYKELKKTKGKV